MSIKSTPTSKIKSILAAVVLFVLFQPAYGETTIGRWCDGMIPNMPKYNRTMAIVAGDDGKIVLQSKFGDGSSRTSQLRESAGGIYELVGSGSGDKYRIIPSDGSLQLLDNDGLIRVATRLGNTPKSDECSK
jgi:hypothetical protein